MRYTRLTLDARQLTKTNIYERILNRVVEGEPLCLNLIATIFARLLSASTYH